MPNINKAILKVAKANPEFRRQLLAAARQLDLLPPKINLKRFQARAEKVLHALPRMDFFSPEGPTPVGPGINPPVLSKVRSGKHRGQWAINLGVKTGGRPGVYMPGPKMKRGIATLEREFGVEYVDFYGIEKGWGVLIFIPKGE